MDAARRSVLRHVHGGNNFSLFSEPPFSGGCSALDLISRFLFVMDVLPSKGKGKDDIQQGVKTKDNKVTSLGPGGVKVKWLNMIQCASQVTSRESTSTTLQPISINLANSEAEYNCNHARRIFEVQEPHQHALF